MKPWTTLEIKKAATLWRTGKSLVEMAAALDRSLESVRHKIAADRDNFPRRKRLRGTAGKLVKVRFEVSEYLYGRIRAAAKRKNMSMTAHIHTVMAKHYMGTPQ